MYARSPVVAAFAAGLLAAGLLAPSPARAQHEVTAASTQPETMTAADELVWRPDPDFPELDRAVLRGDPRFAEPYVYRMRAYAPARLPLHAHPRTVYVTVLRGTLLHGREGETREQARGCGPGCFLVIPPGHGHHGWLDPGTVVQVHGAGPAESVPTEPAPER